MLQLMIGFFIAVVIALTGVGAGVVTAPLLILFLHVPVEIAVSTALAYAAIVKLIVVPVQMVRKQVSYRILLWMVLGGIPGVIIGSLFFRRVALHGPKALLYVVLGSIIIFSSGWQLFRHFRPDAIQASIGGSTEMDWPDHLTHCSGSGLFFFGCRRTGNSSVAGAYFVDCCAGGGY